MIAPIQDDDDGVVDAQDALVDLEHHQTATLTACLMNGRSNRPNPANASDATADDDGDELSNRAEYLNGTNPGQRDSDLDTPRWVGKLNNATH